MSKERIDKLLSHEGFGSRKDIRKLLRNCEVLVNGTRTYDPGLGFDVEKDQLSIDGEIVDFHGHLYLMMNKVMHTISSNKDGEHQTVFDLLDDNMKTPYLQDKLHLIGRLDMDTEGLLLFTTDGELTHRLISPKSHISKTYFCVLQHKETDDHRAEIEKQFLEGIEVGPDDNEAGFKCEPAYVKWPTSEQIIQYTAKSSIAEVLGDKIPDSPETALLTIYEGKYHQVKRMFEAVGNKIVFLKRISMGSLQLDENLNPGEYKLLNDDDLEKLI